LRVDDEFVNECERECQGVFEVDGDDDEPVRLEGGRDRGSSANRVSLHQNL